MSSNITVAYAQQYASTIQVLLQQKGSRLRDCCTPHPITGAKAAVIIEQIGKVEARRRTTRYPALTPQDTPHDRPWVYPVDYDWNDLIDSIDKLRTVIDPQSTYAQNGTYAIGRAYDNEILAGFYADRTVGENQTTVTWATEGQTVANNFGAAAAVGLTVAKLREAKRQFLAAEVDVENDPLYLAVKARQHDNLLAEIQVTSLDFNDKPVLVEGLVQRFLGFNFKHTELVPANATPNDRVPAWAKSGMHIATWNDISTDISQRKDLAGLPWQVYVYATLGAVRSEGKKISEVICA